MATSAQSVGRGSAEPLARTAGARVRLARCPTMTLEGSTAMTVRSTGS